MIPISFTTRNIARNDLLDEIKQLKEENQRLRQENLELKVGLNAKLRAEQERIDLLCKDITKQFNVYMEDLKSKCAIIEEPKLEVCEFAENSVIAPRILNWVEIRIEPLRLRFVKG